MTDRQVTRRLRTGEWARARRGLLVPSRPVPPSDADVQVLSAVRSTRRDTAVALAHAARVWDLPEPLGGWGEPVLLAASGATRAGRGLRVLVAPVAEGDVLRLADGLVVTSPRRTVLDCLRHLRAPDALAIADAAVRAQLVTPADLTAGAALMAGWPGIVQARRLLPLVDGRRESPLESWSAVAFDDQGVPQPEAQMDVLDESGLVIGRVDVRWRCGVIGESDGRAKYRLAAAERDGVTAEGLARVLAAEREREQRLRDTGATVVRWGAADVLDPVKAGRLARRLREELWRQERRPVSGTSRPARLMLAPSTGLRLLGGAERYLLRA